eukprot:5176773-Amphidinium_carterae.1
MASTILALVSWIAGITCIEAFLAPHDNDMPPVVWTAVTFWGYYYVLRRQRERSQAQLITLLRDISAGASFADMPTVYDDNDEQQKMICLSINPAAMQKYERYLHVMEHGNCWGKCKAMTIGVEPIPNILVVLDDAETRYAALM